jgi:hypothetical protein
MVQGPCAHLGLDGWPYVDCTTRHVHFTCMLHSLKLVSALHALNNRLVGKHFSIGKVLGHSNHPSFLGKQAGLSIKGVLAQATLTSRKLALNTSVVTVLVRWHNTHSIIRWHNPQTNLVTQSPVSSGDSGPSLFRRQSPWFTVGTLYAKLHTFMYSKMC